MRHLIRGALVVGVLAVLPATGAAAPSPPAGPRLAVIKLTWNPHRTTLLTVNPDGGAPMRLAGGQRGSGPVDSLSIAPLSWSPDGTKVAYTGLSSFFLAGADGSGAYSVNAAFAESPVFAPDGHTIAFTRGSTIWTIDLVSGEQRQLTPSRPGLQYIASSFSPDGTTLLATRFDTHRTDGAEPVALHLDTGGVTRLLVNGLAPVYSPDGTKVALFRNTEERGISDLFVLNLASGSLRQLTHTPHKDELIASWDSSGERIAFVRFRERHYEWANSIIQMNADGTCETEVLSRKRTVFYSVAWQPGTGREAGQIDC